MPFKLLIQPEHNPEHMVPVKQEWEGEVIIGRGGESGFRLPDRRKVISSRHAKISQQGDDYVLVDVGSINGTFLNGRRIPVGTPVPLVAHDQIGIGGYVLDFVPIDSINRAEVEDSDATLCVQPSETSSTAIIECLKKRYAELLLSSMNTEEREVELVKCLQEAISGLEQKKRDEILSTVEKAFLQEVPTTERLEPGDAPAEAEILERIDSVESGDPASVSRQKSDLSAWGAREEQVLTVLLDFVLDSLKGRRQFQKELEVEVTRIFGKERNPIKWAESSQDIRTYLFKSMESQSQFPRIMTELKQVLEDLALHPVGLMAGLRECVRFLLKQLDPMILEMESEQKKKTMGSRLLPLGLLGNHPAWEHFKEKHRQLREEEIKTFHRLLGPEFAKGYLRAYQQQKS